jgi:hypothetical protein
MSYVDRSFVVGNDVRPDDMLQLPVTSLGVLHAACQALTGSRGVLAS